MTKKQSDEEKVEAGLAPPSEGGSYIIKNGKRVKVSGTEPAPMRNSNPKKEG